MLALALLKLRISDDDLRKRYENRFHDFCDHLPCFGKTYTK